MKKIYTILFFFFCICKIDTTQAQKTAVIDSSFGSHGLIQFSSGTYAVYPNGKIIAAAIYDHPKLPFGPDTVGVSLTKYTKNGIVDTSFGINGTVLSTPVNLNNGGFGLSQVMLFSNGKILVAANDTATASDKYGEEDFPLCHNILLAFNADGSADTTLKSPFIKGVFRLYIVQDVQLNRYTAITEDQKIISTYYTDGGILDCDQEDGCSLDFGPSYSTIYRLNKNGSQDSSLNYYSYADNSIDTIQKGLIVSKLLPLSGGRILLTGPGFMEKYFSNGRKDSSFGLNATVASPLISDVFVESNGKIVTAGTSVSDKGHHVFAVSRYKASGVPDSSFGTNGIVYTPFGNNEAYGAAITEEKNGGIVVAGNSFDSVHFTTGIAIARYMPHGELYNDFANGGKGIVTTDHSKIKSIAVQPDGKIIVFAEYYNYLGLVRFDKNNDTTNKQTFALKQPVANASISLFPNPASDMIYVKGLSSSSKTLSIVDMNGKNRMSIVTADDNYAFNIKQLSPGTYFIKIEDGKNTATLKFVKE